MVMAVPMRVAVVVAFGLEKGRLDREDAPGVPAVVERERFDEVAQRVALVWRENPRARREDFAHDLHGVVARRLLTAVLAQTPQ